MPTPSDLGSSAASGRPRSKKRIIAFSIAGLLLIAMTAVMLHLWSEVRDLRARLATANRWTEFIERKLHEAREEAAAFYSQAEEAQARATEAQQQAEEMTRARRMAELEREFAREEADLARLESERALERAERSERQVQELRKQRERELNRMQEALSRIAETVRTPVGMVVNLSEDSFLFDFDKAVLRPENREILSRIAGVLLASHGYRLYVYGHTDDVGPESYNEDLSRRRAQAVSDYLIEAGIPANIIEVQGFGESSPAVERKDRHGRQKNRRVEIGVIDTVIHFSGNSDR